MTEPAPRPDTSALSALVADAVLTVPGVLGLSPGAFGEVGTYLAGRRVLGVRWVRGRCEVHIVARFGTNLTALAHQVRSRLAPLVEVPVDVVLADVCTDGDEATAQAPETLP